MADTAAETKKEKDDDIQSVEGVLKSSGDGEHKFSMLVDLISQKQVSNKDVVNTVLHLVSTVAPLLVLLSLQWPAAVFSVIWLVDAHYTNTHNIDAMIHASLFESNY